MDLSRKFFEQFLNTLKDVFVPILNFEGNQVDWTELISKDLMEKFNSFNSQLYLTIGQMSGKTWLPLPPAKLMSSTESDKEKAHVFENSIITWTKQIKNILKQEPEMAFKAGENPDPIKEIEFWRTRTENLNSIYSQLKSQEVSLILKTLHEVSSTYTNPFEKLRKEIRVARREANDNYKYLKPLREWFEKLTSSSDFVNTADLFTPIMHLILLIWNHSLYYNTPSRIVVLIREICNSIIANAREFIPGEKIILLIQSKEEVPVACEKLQLAIDVCTKFKDAYFDYKTKSEGKWKFPPNALFIRLDSFLERCHDILNITNTINQFNKLENIQIGGTKGKYLTETVKLISEEFNSVVQDLGKIEHYDIMDIAAKEFDDEFYRFRNKIKELERRLASVITQAFDDNDTLSGQFKILETFEGLLNRPIIQDELEKKHIVLIESYKNDLKIVQNIFIDNQIYMNQMDEKAPIYANMPPVSGSLTWTNGLHERISEPFSKLSSISPAITDKEEYKDVQKLYNSITQRMREYENYKVLTWEKEILESTDEKLNKTLLSRNEADKTLKVNFDPALVRLLREVKYFNQLGLKIPDNASAIASEIFAKGEFYRTQINKLDLLVFMYNTVVQTLNNVEEPLVRDKIAAVDEVLKPGIEELRWKQTNIADFISKATARVESVYKIACKMKEDLKKIKGILESMNKPMIYPQAKTKPNKVDEFITNHSSYITSIHQKVRSDGSSINKTIKEIWECVKVDKKGVEWGDYQNYLNDIIISGISTAICTSMQSLNEMIDMNKRRDSANPPILNIDMQLAKIGVIYDPEISEYIQGPTVRNLIRTMEGDFIGLGILIKRIDTGGQGDYLVELKDNFEMRESMAMVTISLDQFEEETKTFRDTFKDFEDYWINDPEVKFAEFLDTAEKEVKPEETDESQQFASDENNPLMVGVKTKIPKGELFDQRINELKAIKEKILATKRVHDIGWVRINVSPLVDALNRKIDSWITIYTKFLLNQVISIVKNCADFERYLREGIEKDPSEDSKNLPLLMKVMVVLSKHRLVSNRMEINMAFTKEMITLVKDHNVDTKGEETKFLIKNESDNKGVDFMAVIDEQISSFHELFQKVISVKNNMLELQNHETQALKARVNVFSEKVRTFREEFLKEAPFDYNTKMTKEEIDFSYDKLNKYHTDIDEQIAHAKKLNEDEILFEVATITKFKGLHDCKADVEKLKHLWDAVSIITNAYRDWMATPWRSINTSAFSFENEVFVNTMKMLPKEVKFFKGYAILSEQVNQMKKVLNCISKLASDYIQDRHWETLSKEVGVKIEQKSPAFAFSDLVDANIGKYENQVGELEEVAINEAKIGKALNEMETAWVKALFEFELFTAGGGGETKVFKPFDTIQETLDGDTVKVLGLLSKGKSVDFFKERLDNMKLKLNTIDSTIDIWGKVQKNWKRLVNIFMLSEDIRAQLPEATRLFEQKNQQFRDIMTEVQINPIIIEACTKERRDELEEIFKSIEECEKKLNMYLEQKKKAFPRFYFVSNQTLIDILSNGNNIVKISQEYLGDCFDGIRALKMLLLPSGEMSQTGEGIYSKDTEYVPFPEDDLFYPMEPIESWLAALELKMKTTIYNILTHCKHSCDEAFASPDVKDDKCTTWMDWMYNYPAQISLLALQIAWTDDVHKAFDDIEMGMTNAMRDSFELIKRRISLLIGKVRENLSKENRDKIITLITIDVHSRDVLDMFVQKNINDKESFQWYSQLKFYWSKEASDVIAKQRPRYKWEEEKDKSKAIIKIVDWFKFYSCEYVGNCGRLVITPLTDRCYITLTQALSLYMGGAPAGPAGTGKTETTKDLSRACGLPIFVFNCSEQMTTESLALVFMGLAQTGAWGCFDEFNRITIEVLSVVSTQVKSVLDALRVYPSIDKFVFMGEEEINLKDTVGMFITMNPGYAGRTELPDSLKALFRSCAMVVPELVLICENMLMSEGYEMAKELSKKFVSLYILSRSLLSNQKHYDWGLRAVKSVLRQAGKLKRNNPTVDENPLLMSALLDFNTPKIVTDDKPIFKKLLEDLFPNQEFIEKFDVALKELVAEEAKKLKLIPDDTFCVKCVQFSEILEVRHCCFIIGPPGSGKSTVWKTLAATNKRKGEEVELDTLEPKAVTSDELFGTLSKTKEFKNGVLSSIIKNQCKDLGKYKPTHKHKWAILDGDIDPEWIESLNTVMDDNKVLTLVSQDRFPLTPSMRLIFEIAHLKNATVATVSRAGVLYINDIDIGWQPYMGSWLNSHKPEEIKAVEDLPGYIPRPVFDTVAQAVFLKCQQYLEIRELSQLKHITPMVDIMKVETTCTIVDALCLKHKDIIANKKDDEQRKTAYEGIFLFAGMWGIGGSLVETGESKQYYDRFSFLWKTNAKIKYPEIQGPDGKNLSIFDFFWDSENLCWQQWGVPIFEAPDEIVFTKIFVPNVYTIRIRDIIESHIERKRSILLVGSAGTGKTAIIKDYLGSIQSENLMKSVVNFSSRTTSESLQNNIMNSGLTKLSMRKWGLGSGRTLIYFIDDINMPVVEKYGTQAPICLVRQIMDYGLVYERENMEDYNILQDMYFCACLNPKAGSFVIDLRLQRHFTVLALPTPNERIIRDIYNSILSIHFSQFDQNIQNLGTKLVNSTIAIYFKITSDSQLLPTAKKFHYLFNLREMSKVSEGLVYALPASHREASTIVRLWVHECKRVFEDRLLFEDIPKFRTELQKVYEANGLLEYSKDSHINENLDVFTTFMAVFEGNDKTYLPSTLESLKKTLEEKLVEYNESKAQMNLVLFNYAIEHICRISRILDRNAGNALLVGVGGSGKQSLTRLASFIQNYDLETIIVTSSYSADDLKAFLAEMMKKATKPPGSNRVFLMTDTQIRDEEFLVYINDILSSGYIPGLYPRDELDSHLMSLKNEARANGYKEDPESLMLYFIDKIKKNFHVVLAFSPVGDQMRIRARKFPGIINGTMINYFHGWPKDALIDVAYNFLQDVELPSEGIREGIANNMAETHTSIEDANRRYLLQEKRYNYTTPKSFLELISFYKEILGSKRKAIDLQIETLSNGLRTLAETQDKVKGLQDELNLIMIQVEDKTQKTNNLIKIVDAEKAVATEEQAKANEEEKKTSELAETARIIAEEADAAFAEADPKRQKAMAALDSLQPDQLTFMKALPKPTPPVRRIGKVILYMYKKERVDFFGSGDDESSWNKFKVVLANPTAMITQLRDWALNESRKMTPQFIEPIKKLEAKGDLNDDVLKAGSDAAMRLGQWAKSIIEYNEACRLVEPLEAKKNAALAEKDGAEKSLEVVREKVRVINEKVAGLQAQLDDALAQKAKVEAEKDRYQTKLAAAAKLVVGLSEENSRWKLNVESLTKETQLVIGDSLLASAFVSYIGAFSAGFRLELWQEKWIPDIKERKIPISEGVEPLKILTTSSKIATWKNQGLPEDNMSLENASIITNSKRWPLIIDPQLQGSTWIRGHVAAKLDSSEQEAELVRFSLNNDKWMFILQSAISNGKTVMIENVPQEIDPLLNPLLERAIVKKGRSFVISLGGEDPIDYDTKFMLYLQCKSSNPHFRPEIAAQCTLINFIVTEAGLEDQLLALVVNVEKPDLEQRKQELVRRQNENEVLLADLEKQLLDSLNSADPATILDNTELINRLDLTKKTVKDILAQNEEAKGTEKKINVSRDIYRDVAQEGAMLYFLIISLCMVDHMYQYSLDSFISFFYKAIRKTTTQDEIQRVLDLRLNIRWTVFQWISRGLFVRHNIIFLTMLTFRLMQKKVIKVEYEPEEMKYLLRAVPKADVDNPMKDWLPNNSWGLVLRLSELKEFKALPDSISTELTARFKEWYNELAPEEVKMPGDWRKLEGTPFRKLCVLRAMRPDRMIPALTAFIKTTLPNGEAFVNMDSSSSFSDILTSCLDDGKQEAVMNTPIFFILSSGSNPVAEVEKIAKREGFETSKNNWHYISLGQGQDKIAEARLDAGNRDGFWILLQNIHLMPKWLPALEKRLDGYVKEGGSHTNFRLFLSAEPSNSIPFGILERCIKLTNEPPIGLKPNMQRSWTYFPKEEVEDKDPRVKAVLFGLCYFHATLTERRKFGPKGWNMIYPFTTGDLYCSYLVLVKNIENNPGKLPWADFQYIFGQIMYGGHIVDDWDRILCMSYLEYLMAQNLVMDDFELLPFVEGKNVSFRTPAQVSYSKYFQHIEDSITYETPLLYGLHPNAEIGLGNEQCNMLFNALQEVQPKEKEASSEGGETAKADIGYINRILFDQGWKSFIFNIADIRDKFTEKGPYQNVFLQECEYMNYLLNEIIRSLEELYQGTRGNLTFSENMEKLQESLNNEKVPDTWASLAYPAKRSLPTWLDNLYKRFEQLNTWKDDPMTIPKVTRIDYMFNPKSFLTAVMQFSKKAALNQLMISTEFQKWYFEDVPYSAKEGAYVFGFLLEGARWDISLNCLDESKPKEMFCLMPVVLCRPVPLPTEGKEDKTVYKCPVYRTEKRFDTYIFTAQLKTNPKNPPRKWIIAGVAIILDVEGLSDEVRKVPEKK